MKTFSREHWEAAQQAWIDGDFSEEWKPYRHQAAMRGMLYPPEGSKWDGWDEDEPSARAMLIRAIREAPETLRAAIASSHSWPQVVARVTFERDQRLTDAFSEERRLTASKADEPTYREAVQSIAAIVHRIGELVP